MAGRLAEAVEAARRAVRPDPSNGRPAVLAARALLAIGLDEAETGALAARLIESAGRDRMQPLLVTSLPGHALFMRPGLACEYLPPSGEAALAGAPPGTVALYLWRRLAIMLDRWTATECLWAGPEAADLVAAGRQMPGFDSRTIRFADAEVTLGKLSREA